MRNLKFLLFIVLISLLPLWSFWITNDLVHTHDGLVHLPRIAAYFQALQDGHFPVRWAGNLNYGYGLPLFNFIYHLPYLIASFFLSLGVGLVASFKATLSLSFLLSGVFMYLFARIFFNDEKKGLFVAVFYQFAPFRLVDLLVRGSFGEVYTYTFLPLVLLGIVLLHKKVNDTSFVLTAAGVFFLILSHNSVSLLYFTIAFAFLAHFKNKKTFSWGAFTLLVGLLLSAYYWVPAIFEHRYTYGDLFMKELYKEHFVPLSSYFLPNFFNTASLRAGGVSVQIGIFHVLALFISCYFLFYKKIAIKNTKAITIFSLVLIGIALFFTQSVSQIIWENVSLLRQFQFPWRFLSVIVFATSLLAVNVFLLPILKKKIIYWLIIVFVIASTAHYWKPQEGYDTINESDYWNFPLNTTYYGETDVIWSKGPASAYPKNRVDLIGGKGVVKDFSQKTHIQTFTIDAKTNVQLVSHTPYFPGWRVYVENSTVPIEFQDPNNRGEITFYVPKGKHNVQIVFGESRLRLTADIISLSTLFSLLFLGIFKIAVFKK